MKISTIGLISVVCALQSTMLSLPARADYYRYVRHERRMAAKQEYEARRDAAYGLYGKAAMHERKAARDRARANGYRYRIW